MPVRAPVVRSLPLRAALASRQGWLDTLERAYARGDFAGEKMALRALGVYDRRIVQIEVAQSRRDPRCPKPLVPVVTPLRRER